MLDHIAYTNLLLFLSSWSCSFKAFYLANLNWKSQRFFFSLILFNLHKMPVSCYNLQTLFSSSPTARAPSLRRRNPGTCTSTSISKCRHLIENVVYRLFVELGISHDSETDSDSDVYCYFVMLRNIPWSWLVLLSLLAFLPSVFFFLFNPK